MHRPIWFTRTTSSCTTSQASWPNDNKAVGNCFRALIAGLRPASLILARRIAFPLLFSVRAGARAAVRGSERDLDATGSLDTARYRHTATLLPNGKVLVAGGFNSLILASAELYDPASGTWTATGSLATARC